jgi:SAM-dependent methyltransferase
MNTKQPHVAVPRIDIDSRLADSNIFADVFGSLTPGEWVETLVRSIDERVIDGVEFPGFPSPEFQSQLHGHFGRYSLLEAAAFYDFVRAHGLTGPEAAWFGKGHLLDFGAGWGRITRLFLRDFPLRHIIGYEPSNRFCSVARSNNPFVSYLSGGYLPDGMIPDARFDLVVAWSVFSHLSPKSARAWLAEIQRVTRPGAAIVMTTWGRRFLDRLQRERAMLANGQDIHWYSKVCLNACGDLEARIEEYDRGAFVWFTGGQSDLYGEAFLGEGALRSLLADCAPRLSLTVFDTGSLAQDAFVLRHTG